MDMSEAVKKFGDRTWRLNNLYWIKDKQGNAVQFRLNRAQRRLLKGMHHRGVILKARQLGFSTLIQVLMLDACLFNSNTDAGVIAQDLDAATDIFENKIKFAFDRLPESLRDRLAPTQDSARKLTFTNGSSIVVGTSMRSGTFQYLHVSEMGRIAAKRPDKAKEIVTGSFEAVPDTGVIFVESTAEGRDGAFYDLVKQARDHADSGKPLQNLDWKFHFFPWWEEPGYVSDPEHMVLHPPMRDYFAELEAKHGIKLTREQKAWYALKSRNLGEDVKREYPSHPDEAFEQSIVGAYFARQFRKIRELKRITSIPYDAALPVITAWDLGMRDPMAIWFAQVHGREIRLIDYYENSGEGLDHYAAVLQERQDEFGYRYARHFAPHDIEVRDLSIGQGLTRKDIAARLGIHFETVTRIANEQEGIEPMRQILPLCFFDEERCDQGIKALEHFRKEWDERLGTYRNRPLHDWSSHGAKAFQTLARANIFETGVPQAVEVVQQRSMWA